MDHQNSVWLQGKRYNEVYLFNLDTGKPEEFQISGDLETTAGNGWYLNRTFVAIYVDSDRQRIWLQIGTLKVPLDGDTRAISQVHAAGLYSTVAIEREGFPTIKLRQRTLGRLVFQIIDPTYDGLDEMMDDQADGIAHIVNSEESRVQYLEVKDPQAGPWYLLDEDHA